MLASPWLFAEPEAFFLLGVGKSTAESHLRGNGFLMKLVAAEKIEQETPSDTETFVISRAQLDYLGRIAHQINPDMPMAFAGAHVIRTLLERFEESGIDLTAASSEEELTRVAARELRQRDREDRQTNG